MTARLLLLLAVLAAPARAAEVRGQARVWLGPGVDSNARRDFVAAGGATQADAFLFGLGQADGLLLLGQRGRVQGGYDVAARKFVQLPSEDTVVQAAQLEASVALARVLAVGVSGRVRDRRGAERDYTDLVGGLVVDFTPDAQLDVRLALNAHRFLFYNRFAYSFFGPDGALSARFRVSRRHALSAFGGFMPRTYHSPAAPYPGPEGTAPETLPVRQDAVLSAGATYAYRGPVHLSLGYAYVDQTSNSFGETLRRHRVTLTAGVRLPWQVTALAAGTLQLSLFPDGVYLSPDLTVVEDDENSSSVTLKLVRPLARHLDLDLRYALYVNVLPQNQFIYLRHVGSLGLALHF